MNFNHEKLKHFLMNFEGDFRTSSQVRYRQDHITTESLEYRSFNSMNAHDLDQYITQSSVECLELIIPIDRIDQMTSLCDREELELRIWHPSVRKSWEQYRIMLAMARKNY